MAVSQPVSTRVFGIHEWVSSLPCYDLVNSPCCFYLRQCSWSPCPAFKATRPLQGLIVFNFPGLSDCLYRFLNALFQRALWYEWTLKFFGKDVFSPARHWLCPGRQSQCWGLRILSLVLGPSWILIQPRCIDRMLACTGLYRIILVLWELSVQWRKEK